MKNEKRSNDKTLVKNKPNAKKSVALLAKPLSFDLKTLAKDCIAKRETEGLSLRIIQKTNGIGFTQLWAIESEASFPNANTLAKVIDWLGLPVEKYFVRK